MNEKLRLQSQLGKARRFMKKRYYAIFGLLCLCLVTLLVISLVFGKNYVSPLNVFSILIGDSNQNASFTIMAVRLPRALIAILCGLSFGLAGVIFQIMLRNPLASPDIIGISSGASAAAVFAIVVLAWQGISVSIFAVLFGLLIAIIIYVLALKNGLSGARLILIGIGVSAMLDSFIAYILAAAPSWTLQEAMRWLSGSLNGVRLVQAFPLFIGFLCFLSLLLLNKNALELLRFGDDKAASLGVSLTRTRIFIILAAVGLIAFATVIAGPIAFVAFLSGPIAARIIGRYGSILLPAAIIGAILVLISDYCGQYLLPGRFPVGVVTGVLGAPYLLYLIIRTNKGGVKI